MQILTLCWREVGCERWLLGQPEWLQLDFRHFRHTRQQVQKPRQLRFVLSRRHMSHSRLH